MMNLPVRRLLSVLVVGLLGVVPAVSIGIGTAGATSTDTLVGEQFAAGYSFTGTTFQMTNLVCATSPTGTSSFAFTADGTATGPIPGTFTESASVTFGGALGPVTTTANFTLTDTQGNVAASGAIISPSALIGSGVSANGGCGTPAGDMHVVGNVGYNATFADGSTEQNSAGIAMSNDNPLTQPPNPGYSMVENFGPSGGGGNPGGGGGGGGTTPPSSSLLAGEGFLAGQGSNAGYSGTTFTLVSIACNANGVSSLSYTASGPAGTLGTPSLPTPPFPGTFQTSGTVTWQGTSGPLASATVQFQVVDAAGTTTVTGSATLTPTPSGTTSTCTPGTTPTADLAFVTNYTATTSLGPDTGMSNIEVTNDCPSTVFPGCYFATSGAMNEAFNGAPNGPPPPPPSGTVTGTLTLSSTFPAGTVSGVVACPAGEPAGPNCPSAAVAYTGGVTAPYSLNLPPGGYDVEAFAAPGGNYGEMVSSAPILVTLGQGQTVTEDFALIPPTNLAYNGATQGAVADPVSVSATLSDGLGNPVSGELITITLGTASCSATTNSEGVATCILTPTGPAGAASISASFAGNGQYLPSSTSVAFAIGADPCDLCALSPSASPALTLTGNGAITVSAGNIVVDSTGKPAASLTGNGTVTASEIGGPGAPLQFRVTGNGHFSPTPVARSAVADPMAELPMCTDATPPSACPNTVQSNVGLTGNSSATINPGIYSTISLTGNGSLTLNPGTYVVTGSLTVTGNGSMKGTGVTIFLACSAYPKPCATGQTGASISLTGNGDLTLSAPTTGEFQGMSILADRNNAATDTLTGNGLTIGGTVYAASSAMSLTGNGGIQAGRMIVKVLTLTGNGSLKIT